MRESNWHVYLETDHVSAGTGLHSKAKTLLGMRGST